MALFAKGIASLEGRLEKARTELTAAETAFAEAVGFVENPPLSFSDDQVDGLVAARNGCEGRLVRAKVEFRRAQTALNDACAAAEERQRRESLERVLALGVEAQKVVRHELTAAITGMRKAIKLMGEAEAARQELNLKLPADQRLESFEFAVLGRPGVPEKTIKTELLLKWVSANGDILFSEEEEARLLVDHRSGTAKLPRQSSAGEDVVAFRRRFFERRVVLPGTSPRMEGALSETVRLPGLDGGPPGWEPVDPGAALRMLAELEDATSTKPAERTPPVETVRPVSPVLATQEEVDRWDREHAPADAAE
ncbi:hypothetical protein [Bradyrhizobium sp. UFLA03-84]|uniref:hypothetical protein n=1 Tax=Bradyrhizobium sp. UFLA03-84 TaxID=418599 RepID=UPI0011787258|nr:hypothetical protein [Bradyrhizobium sp. UFLA03-84]